MRGIIISGWLMFCALVTSGEESPGSVALRAGGFAPVSANFAVTFGFSNMTVVAKSADDRPRVLAALGGALIADEWMGPDGVTVRLEVCCVKRPVGVSLATLAAARLRLTNAGRHPFHTTLAVAIAPQGGGIRGLAFEKHAFVIEGRPVMVADTPSRGAILADSPFAPRPLSPQDQAHVESAKGECRGEMFFDLSLAPGQTQSLGFVCPVHLPAGLEPDLDFYRALSVEELFAQAEKEARVR